MYFKIVGITILLSSLLPAQSVVCGHKQDHADLALTRTSMYSSSTPGFDLKTIPDQLGPSGCSSDASFFVSFPLPEGSYTVSIDLGGSSASVTTVRAEARRLMLHQVALAAGQHRIESFSVTVRRPEIPGGNQVKRKPRELGSLNWDNKLTLEFSGRHASVRRITVRPSAATLPTVYLAGDSTVVDQDNDPWAAWGQMLPSFFGPGIAIANYAESGETIKSFEREQRFAKIFSLLKAGDYLFFQFAHNDQKPGGGYVSIEEYTALLWKYAAMATERGAHPVFVTSMNRRTFDDAGHIRDTLAPYPQAMRDLAAQEYLPLIDLNAMSKLLYEAVGEANSRSLFVYAAPNTYPGQKEALHDDTHFNSYGAYELARCLVEGIKTQRLPLTRFLRDPKSHFDPASPDAPADLVFPASPFVDTETPYER